MGREEGGREVRRGGGEGEGAAILYRYENSARCLDGRRLDSDAYSKLE